MFSPPNSQAAEQAAIFVLRCLPVPKSQYELKFQLEPIRLLFWGPEDAVGHHYLSAPAHKLNEGAVFAGARRWCIPSPL